MLTQLLLKCGSGFFVEFGARNGIDHSNTLFFERQLGWTGLLFEVDPNELTQLRANRPKATVYDGAVCPSSQIELSFGISKIPGWSGSATSYEPSRNQSTARVVSVKCYHLAAELRRANVRVVDYMTIDTEGSEPEIVEDFPWSQFEVSIVQIEQLDERGFPAQRGKKDRVVRHMTSQGYDFYRAYTVAVRDTEDLIFVLRRHAPPRGLLHHVLNGSHGTRARPG